LRGVKVVRLTDIESDQLAEALRLALIYMQEHPSDTSPVNKVRTALKLLTENGSDKSQYEENNIL
jgi:hypothetical protein